VKLLSHSLAEFVATQVLGCDPPLSVDEHGARDFGHEASAAQDELRRLQSRLLEKRRHAPFGVTVGSGAVRAKVVGSDAVPGEHGLERTPVDVQDDGLSAISFAAAACSERRDVSLAAMTTCLYAAEWWDQLP
jgi:hypothetical protein